MTKFFTVPITSECETKGCKKIATHEVQSDNKELEDSLGQYCYACVQDVLTQLVATLTSSR